MKMVKVIPATFTFISFLTINTGYNTNVDLSKHLSATLSMAALSVPAVRRLYGLSGTHRIPELMVRWMINRFLPKQKVKNMLKGLSCVNLHAWAALVLLYFLFDSLTTNYH